MVTCTDWSASAQEQLCLEKHVACKSAECVALISVALHCCTPLQWRIFGKPRYSAKWWILKVCQWKCKSPEISPTWWIWPISDDKNGTKRGRRPKAAPIFNQMMSKMASEDAFLFDFGIFRTLFVNFRWVDFRTFPKFPEIGQIHHSDHFSGHLNFHRTFFNIHHLAEFQGFPKMPQCSGPAHCNVSLKTRPDLR